MIRGWARGVRGCARPAELVAWEPHDDEATLPPLAVQAGERAVVDVRGSSRTRHVSDQDRPPRESREVDIDAIDILGREAVEVVVRRSNGQARTP